MKDNPGPDSAQFDMEYVGDALPSSIAAPPATRSDGFRPFPGSGNAIAVPHQWRTRLFLLRRRYARSADAVLLLTLLGAAWWILTSNRLHYVVGGAVPTVGTDANPDFPPNEIPFWDPQVPSTTRWWSRPSPPRYQPNKDIPNIAHFVRQINRHEDGQPKPFKVEFRHLLSYYSCHMFLQPEKIYFWTDAPAEVLQEARLNGNVYTRALFRIPNLSIQPASFPNATMSGTKIEQYAHKSDFVRTRIMAKMGGMYFDDDAWVLRDLTPLRKAGFDNVFSLDEGARIAQACWLSKPRNPLMIAFARLQDIVFNGEWLRASNDLITALMVHYARAPGDRSALVLEKDAFFPGYWIGEGLNDYYEVHDDDDVKTFQEMDAPSPFDDITSTFQFDKKWGWRRDWRRTWVIHGFSNELRARKAQWMFKEFNWFSPAYVLSQRSNIGRALYPALRHMLDSGFLILTEEETRLQPA